MSENQNQLPDFVRFWTMIRNRYPARDWIIRGHVAICVGALPGYGLAAGNDNTPRG